MKKILALLLSAVLTASAITGCGTSTNGSASEESSASDSTSGDASTEDGNYKITMAYIGNEQPNQETVLQAVSDLTYENIGMTIEFIQLGFGDYADRLNLMLAGGDTLDILPVFYSYAPAYINANQIVDLSDYIEDYGQGILDVMGEDIATSGAVNGFVYGIPSNKESASLAGIVMRKDIVDNLGIDISSISTYADLTELFATVKAAYPELDMISGTNLFTQIQNYDPLMDSFGVLLEDGQDTTVVNLFETDEYVSKVTLINEWYKAGYVKLDAATTTETSSNLVKAGSLFSYLSSIKPGFLIQENVSCNTEMVTAYIGKEDGGTSNMISTANVNYFNWGIAQQSEDKAKAMEFLNFAYTNADWNNLMNFGIEGEDYTEVKDSETFISYPEGKDSSSAYHLNMGWMLPNQFLGKVWEGQPEDIWQQYQDFNDSAIYSKAFGFIYDSSTVTNEITALSSVSTEFRNSIETGSVPNVEESLADFNNKLYEAGLQTVMDLKQTQLDEWLANNS